MHETGDEATGEDKGKQAGGSGLCGATARDGQPCRAPVLKDGSGFCWMHSPATAEARREAARRGGASTSARRRLLLGRLGFGDLGEIKQGREALAAAVIGGSLVPARAGIVATLLRDAEGALIQYELADRMATIENDLGLLLRGVHPVGGRETV